MKTVFKREINSNSDFKLSCGIGLDAIRYFIQLRVGERIQKPVEVNMKPPNKET